MTESDAAQPAAHSPQELKKNRSMRLMAARGVQYWCYPNKSCGENDRTTVACGRMTYGLAFWRSGFVALIPWIYSSTVSDPMNYLAGTTRFFGEGRQGKDTFVGGMVVDEPTPRSRWTPSCRGPKGP